KARRTLHGRRRTGADRTVHATPVLRQGSIFERGLPVRRTVRSIELSTDTQKERYPRWPTGRRKNVCCQTSCVLDYGSQRSRARPNGAVPSELFLRRLHDGIPA